MAHHDLIAALLATTLVTACDTEPSWESCADAACYTQLAVQRWETDPEGVKADITALDVVAQEAVALALVEAKPTALKEICAALPKGPAAQRCHKLADRPHLLEGRANTSQLREAGVPGLVDHTGIGALPSPWSDLPAAADADCDLQTDQCWNRAMFRAAESGEPPQVAAVCNGIEAERFRRECFFRAAETMAVKDGRARPERLPVAASLCLGAEDYAELCVRELARAIARLAPAADQADTQAWEQTTAAVAAMQAGLEPYDAVVAQRVADRAWTAVLWGSYQRAQTLTGIPLDTLPQPAWPHVRASATWFLLQREGSEHPDRDLAAWTERAAQVLASREPGQPPTQGNVQPTRFVGSSYDPATRDGTWVHYLGDNYRRLLEDPQEDLTACILEAAARQRQDQLLSQAVQAPSTTISQLSRDLQQADIKPAGRRKPKGQGW